MTSQPDLDDLLDALYEMHQATGKRPSLFEAQMKFFPEWDRDRLLHTAEALEASGDILNVTGGLLNVDLSSMGRKKVAARLGGHTGPSSATYNIGSIHNSPLQHIGTGGHGVQTTSYQVSANDLRVIVDLYRKHVDELNLDTVQRRKADAAVATIEAQLIDEPDEGIVKAAGKSLKTIIEGAISGAVGTAITNSGLWAPLLSVF